MPHFSVAQPQRASQKCFKREYTVVMMRPQFIRAYPHHDKGLLRETGALMKTHDQKHTTNEYPAARPNCCALRWHRS